MSGAEPPPARTAAGAAAQHQYANLRPAMTDTELHLKPTTITAAVADRLRDEIRSGALAPGSHLRQNHIAAAYGVSTTPVREAFGILAREGLVQSIAHRGVVVFEAHAAEVREIFEIRVPLEALATELAVPNLTEEDLETLSSLIGKMAAADREGNWKRSVECNDEFHATIYNASHRTRLLKMIAELRSSWFAYTNHYPRLQEQIEESEREHVVIYEACKARHPKKAAKAMANHLRHIVAVMANSVAES